MSNCDDKLQ